MDDALTKIPEDLWDKIETPPVIVIQGECDKYGNGYNSYRFYNAIQSKDKEFWYYPKMNFAVPLEDEFPEIQERIIKWLEKRNKK